MQIQQAHQDDSRPSFVATTADEERKEYCCRNDAFMGTVTNTRVRRSKDRATPVKVRVSSAEKQILTRMNIPVNIIENEGLAEELGI